MRIGVQSVRGTTQTNRYHRGVDHIFPWCPHQGVRGERNREQKKTVTTTEKGPLKASESGEAKPKRIHEATKRSQKEDKKKKKDSEK